MNTSSYVLLRRYNNLLKSILLRTLQCQGFYFVADVFSLECDLVLHQLFSRHLNCISHFSVNLSDLTLIFLPIHFSLLHLSFHLPLTVVFHFLQTHSNS